MIVIATNNGYDTLPQLLRSIEDTNNLDIPVSIVDTGSTDLKFIEYLDTLPSKYSILKIKKGYDTGAYIHAYENLKSDFYIFLQDSVTILSKDFYSIALNHINNSTFFSYHIFESWEGAYTCEEVLPLHFGQLDIDSYKFGVFGPMFACSKEIMDKLYNSKLYFIPKNKKEQMAMERGWGIMLSKLNIPLTYLDHYKVLLQNKSPYIKKYFKDRQ